MAEKPVAIADRLFRSSWRRSSSGASCAGTAHRGEERARARAVHRRFSTKSSLPTSTSDAFASARQLAPVDRFAPPTAAEWALAAMLHDLVQCAHPDLAGVFRGRAPCAARSSSRRSRSSALPLPLRWARRSSRHTWFSRVLEMTRTDTNVSFWVGKRTVPRARTRRRGLLAWPELRRVHIDKMPRPLVDLPAARRVTSRRSVFGDGVAAWLRKTPLTDLATCARRRPPFAWSPETLALVSTRAGRTLALRALEAVVALDVETALGRATQTAARRRAPRCRSPSSRRSSASARSRARSIAPSARAPDGGRPGRRRARRARGRRLRRDASSSRRTKARYARISRAPCAGSSSRGCVPAGQTTKTLLGA